MDLECKIAMLESKDTAPAYQILLELEALSDTSNALYPYLAQFASMIHSEKYVIRVRGFRLFCKQARWDTENRIGNLLPDAFCVLHDEKPTAVRQALRALKDVVLYQPMLKEIIQENILTINYLQYKDSMQGLILKDIENLLDLIAQPS